MNDTTPRPSADEPILRHTGGTRMLHWALAACFLVAMGTGLGLYWRSILSWTLPLYGGKAMAVNLHYWFGLGLGLTTALLFLVWRARARWTTADTHFIRHITEYAARPDQQPPAETGFFNGGQKLYFWAVVGSTVVLVLTGIVWWYRKDMPHSLYAVCRTTHRVLAVIMSAGLLVHIYKATIGEPGTLRSMLRGTVTKEWARTRRPQWFRDLGRGE